MRIVIYAPPCSGKSTFIKINNRKYKGFELHDVEGGMKVKKLPDNACLFSGKPLKRIDGINYFLVEIPKKDLDRNIENRKTEKPNHVWADKKKILKRLENLKCQDVIIVNSFEEVFNGL